MFKPIEFFIKENKTNLDAEAIKQEWSKLDTRDILRYIKQTESAYDKYVQENGSKVLHMQSYGSFLTKTELKILFESYGLPEKLPASSKLYFLQKTIKEAFDNKKDSATDEIIVEDAKKEAEEKWSKLTHEERTCQLREYYVLSRDYHEKYINFARNLPRQRDVDYYDYLMPISQRVHKPKLNESHSNKENRLKFAPFEIFFEKNRDEFTEKYSTLFIAKTKSRTAYLNLNDKKKLKYIKKAEERYDQYHFEDNMEVKPLFSSLLTKADLKLLMDSYGLPETISQTAHGYFYQKRYRDFTENHMKNVMDLFKKQTEEEKAQFLIEYNEKYNEYKQKTQKFLENLPLSRMPDYQAYIQSIKKNKNSKENSTLAPKLNKSVEMVDAASGMSDLDTDLDNTQNSVDIKTGDHLINEFLSENSRQPENGFSLFVNEELEQTKTNGDLNVSESVKILNKIARQWYKLDESEKEIFNERHKTIKKNTKKIIKSFVKNNPDLKLNSEELKTKLNEKTTKTTRQINVHFENDTNEVLNIYNKNLNDYINSDVEEIKVKKDKKRSKLQNGEESPNKKARNESSTTQKKI